MEDSSYILTLSMKNAEIYKKLKSAFTLRIRDEQVECRKSEKFSWVGEYLKNLSKKKIPLQNDIISSTSNSKEVSSMNENDLLSCASLDDELNSPAEEQRLPSLSKNHSGKDQRKFSCLKKIDPPNPSNVFFD